MYKRIYKGICYISFFALLITAIVVMTAMYTSKSSDFKEGVQERAYFAAGVLNGGAEVDFSQVSQGKYRVSIIDTSGELIYDTHGSGGNHNDRPEVIEARSSGFGDDSRRSATQEGWHYYCAVTLDDGRILRISSEFGGFWADFFVTISPILLIVLLAYILSASIAIKAAANMVKSVRDVLDGELDTSSARYSELLEIADKIKNQKSQIQGQRQKLSSQKSQLSIISKNMHEGLAILETDGGIIFINDRCAQILDVHPMGLKYTDFFAIGRVNGLRDKFLNVVENGGENAEYEIDGKMYEIFFSPLTDEQKKCMGVMLLIVDINDKHEAEVVRRDFCANVSHELKTPLTTILGYSQIINSGVAKPDDVLRFTQKIEKETTRLIAIVEDIIKLSSLDEQSEAENEKTDVHILDVARECAERLLPAAEKRGIGINVSGVDFVVSANDVQISEMMYNLTDNAVKYNVDGGRVDIGVFDGGFYVADTGIGIDKEHYDRLFERFFRVDKSRSKKVNGTGLGLSIVKHIANVNNATVSVSEENGGGTRFCVRFEKKN